MTNNQKVLEVLEMHDVPCTTIVDRALARYIAAAEGMSDG
jgi:hypothetical protein